MKARSLLFLGMLAFAAGCITQPQEENRTLQPFQEINFSLFNITADPETGMSSVKTYVFRGSGNSMNPALVSGNEYLCLEQNDYDVGDIVAYKGSLEFVREPSGEQLQKGYALTAHRVTGKTENGYFKIKGDNSRAIDTVPKDSIFCRVVQ